jgi:HD-GYP domain-containing protein (c-di-GMP phosphodiesterase class II)
LAVDCAEALDLSADHTETVRHAAEPHDIGKVGILSARRTARAARSARSPICAATSASINH